MSTRKKVSFPGYTFDLGKSHYRGEEVGEGGYVYSEPGMYTNVALLDIASMHPTSIEQLNLFGDEYTKKFSELKEARIAIKHHDKETASRMLNGALQPYLHDDESLDKLSFALKIVINSVYGLTSAKFENLFKDPRNKDNIVAKRGALFMIDLKHYVQEQGFTVAHIKTDSIKIPDATPEIIEKVTSFGADYGYIFEHEDTYERFCLTNDAVYVALSNGVWHAVGAQFAVPYVYKTLFSHEPYEFSDFCETRTVTTAMYLDMSNGEDETDDNYRFVGRAGRFTPMKEGAGGGALLRKKDDKYYAVGGTKGYSWMESEMVQALKREDQVDDTYYKALVDKAYDSLGKFGDVEWLLG